MFDAEKTMLNDCQSELSKFRSKLHNESNCAVISGIDYTTIVDDSNRVFTIYHISDGTHIVTFGVHKIISKDYDSAFNNVINLVHMYCQ